MTFSERLKELRKAMHLSQQELADKLKVTKGLIGMYEIGKRNPSYEMEELLADFFNVSIDYLRGDENITMRFLNEEHLELVQRYDSRPELRRLISAADKLADDDLERIIKMTEALVPEEK